MASRRPLILAHRGACRQAPENTLAAFELAARMNVDGIEFDVQLSADGVPVVIHDETLERTSDSQGMVRNRTLAVLRRLDCGSWFAAEFAGQRMPTLDEAVEAFPALLNIEVKNGAHPYTGIEAAVLEVLRRHAALDRAVVSSFDHSACRRLHDLEPALRTAILFRGAPVDPSLDALAAGARAIHPAHTFAYPWLVKAAHEAGLEVGVWTVDEEADLARVVEVGVDSIITNTPDRVFSWLDGRP